MNRLLDAIAHDGHSIMNIKVVSHHPYRFIFVQDIPLSIIPPHHLLKGGGGVV